MGDPNKTNLDCEFIELNLIRINGQYRVFNDKDADIQIEIGLDEGYSYIGIPYKVEYIDKIKIPVKYLFEDWKK
jgi:hypothetical protein